MRWKKTDVATSSNAPAPSTGLFWYPKTFWYWYWSWDVLVDALPTFTSGSIAMLDTFREGQGDGVVHKSSALAEGCAGKIRRASYPLHHFAVHFIDEKHTTYETPTGSMASVKPWELLFIELGMFDYYGVNCPDA